MSGHGYCEKCGAEEFRVSDGHACNIDDQINKALEDQRANIVTWMRNVYRQNKHAQEWADAIEAEEDLKTK